MFEFKVKITRFVDDAQPGLVECEFADASGETNRFVDRVPIFKATPLDANSDYPIGGAIDVEIIERKSGRLS
jgi:hypothetical protein